jgi:hypothetical protein
MTTGRINQVTILNRRDPPEDGRPETSEEAEPLPGGDGKTVHPIRAPRPSRRRRLGHPFAPTEFPRAQSAAELLEPHGYRRLQHMRPRWRIPLTRHAPEERLRARAFPRMPCVKR